MTDLVGLICGTAFWFATVVVACGTGSLFHPSSGVIVVFRVSDESFRVWLNSPHQIDAARAAHNGARAAIPNGRIVTGTEVNAGYTWHLEEVELAESTIAICDGRPSDVERQGTKFGNGRYCPWNARVVSIEER